MPATRPFFLRINKLHYEREISRQGTTSARAFLALPLPDPLAAAEGTNSGDKLPQRGLLPARWFKWFAGFI